MVISLKCPDCGADIQLDNDREFGFCMYCGTKVLITRENNADDFLESVRKLLNAGLNNEAKDCAKKECEVHPTSYKAHLVRYICGEKTELQVAQKLAPQEDAELLEQAIKKNQELDAWKAKNPHSLERDSVLTEIETLKGLIRSEQKFNNGMPSFLMARDSKMKIQKYEERIAQLERWYNEIPGLIAQRKRLENEISVNKNRLKERI